MRLLARRLEQECGQALIEGLLALGLVLLVVAFAAEAIAYAHSRSVAEAAAQDGARAAAAAGPQAGIDRAAVVVLSGLPQRQHVWVPRGQARGAAERGVTATGRDAAPTGVAAEARGRGRSGGQLHPHELHPERGREVLRLFRPAAGGRRN